MPEPLQQQEPQKNKQVAQKDSNKHIEESKGRKIKQAYWLANERVNKLATATLRYVAGSGKQCCAMQCNAMRGGSEIISIYYRFVKHVWLAICIDVVVVVDLLSSRGRV